MESSLAIRKGKYAMFLYTGSYEHLSAVYDSIYAKWLPESGEKLRNYHCFEKYINNPANTAPEKLKTEIYVPIEESVVLLAQNKCHFGKKIIIFVKLKQACKGYKNAIK
jgi:hypothetical protein